MDTENRGKIFRKNVRDCSFVRSNIILKKSTSTQFGTNQSGIYVYILCIQLSENLAIYLIERLAVGATAMS